MGWSGNSLILKCKVEKFGPHFTLELIHIRLSSAMWKRQVHILCSRHAEDSKRSLPPVLRTMAGSIEQACVRARVLLWRWLGMRCHMSNRYSATPHFRELFDCPSYASTYLPLQHSKLSFSHGVCSYLPYVSHSQHIVFPYRIFNQMISLTKHDVHCVVWN
jgi:hypothetical protein